MFKFGNFFDNYGFYFGIGNSFIILILWFLYCILGKKSIKFQYLNHQLKIPENKNEKIDIYLSKRNTNVPRINNKNKNKHNIKIASNPPNNKNNSKNIKFKKRRIEKYNNKICININNMNKYENRSDIIELNMSDKNLNEKSKKNEEKNKDIDYDELTYKQAIIKDERYFFVIFFSYFSSTFEILQILFFPKKFSHISLTLALYLYELILDLTFNALLFSDEVISQKYYNNDKLLFITSQILSISSNIISCFIVYITTNLINYNSALESGIIEAKIPKRFYLIFINIFWFINLKIAFFYIIIMISGLFCSYYLFVFCAIFKKIQKNLFLNYLMGVLWSLFYKVGFSLLTTILRKISICGKFKQLYYIAKFINEKFN